MIFTDISSIYQSNQSGTFSFGAGSFSDCGGEFGEMVEKAVSRKNLSEFPAAGLSTGCFVAISPKIIAKMRENADLCENIRSQIEKLQKNIQNNARDSFIVVDRNGEVLKYRIKDDRPSHPTPEELREVAKARARKKARLDAYFHLLEKVCIKRKLIEQENAKNKGKKYRISETLLNRLAESRRLTSPPEPEINI